MLFFALRKRLASGAPVGRIESAVASRRLGCESPFLGLRFVVVVAALALSSFSARASVTRAVSATAGGAAITYSWTSVSGLASSLLLVESLPADAALSVAADSAVKPKAVKRSGAVWSLLVARADALKAGSVKCNVSFSGTGTAVGAWSGLSSTGAKLSGSISGASALARLSVPSGGVAAHFAEGGEAAVSDPESGSEPVPTAADFVDFAILDFSVEPSGAGDTIRFTWTGAGTNAVEIQYSPELAPSRAVAAVKAAASPAGVAAVAASSPAAAGWMPLKTVDPETTFGVEKASRAEAPKFVAAPQAVSESSDGEASRSLSDVLYSYAIRSTAPSGFFRLVVKVPDAATGESR